MCNFSLGDIHKRRLLKGGEGGSKFRNILSKKRVTTSEKWADVVYGWPLSMDSLHDYYKVDSSIVLGKGIQNEYPNTFVSRLETVLENCTRT